MKKNLKALFTVAIASVLMLTACGTTHEKADWRDAPSLKEAYVDGGIFDRFGFACEYPEISDKNTAKGLAYHGNTTTSGNELKPDFVFAWPFSISTKSYTDSAGTTIQVPSSINFAARMDPFLNSVKAARLQMRGHVLVWHSQTPEWFFREDYNANNSLVDKATMTARQEWYIRSVLEHVAEWEAKNGYGEGNHLIYSWDVVNEAVADNASQSGIDFLRGSTPDTKDKSPSDGGSRWYQIYGDDEFIINAFRFANAYAPKDVTLCYNDYNEYQDNKLKGIVKLINRIRAGEEKLVNGELVKPRIDAMGMQSHIGSTWPGVGSYENAIKTYLGLGLDVQITELDVNTTNSEDTGVWSSYLKMIKKYGKNGSKVSGYNGHYVTGLTIWGINDENSWISSGGSKFPLLFKKSGSSYLTKECFYSVLEAAN